VDLKGTTILNKNPKALSWKSFMNSTLSTYYTQFPSMLLVAHIFFMNNTFPHIKINLLLTFSFSFFLFPPKTHELLSLLGTPLKPLLELAPLV
jgi:hypothetical protein